MPLGTLLHRETGRQADSQTASEPDGATIRSRGAKIELVCRWSGVAVLVQTLETHLLRWAAWLRVASQDRHELAG